MPRKLFTCWCRRRGGRRRRWISRRSRRACLADGKCLHRILIQAIPLRYPHGVAIEENVRYARVLHLKGDATTWQRSIAGVASEWDAEETCRFLAGYGTRNPDVFPPA